MTTFTDESGRLFSGRWLAHSEVVPWLAAQSFGAMPANHIVLHHTWSPTYAQWAGRSTLEAIFRYYNKERGWPEGVGPHFWIAPREKGGPVGVFVGTHPRHDGIHVAGFNHRTIGIEVAWNGDVTPFSRLVEAEIRALVFALSSRLGIPVRWTRVKVPGISLHRWHANKSCPGTKNTDVRMAAAMLPPATMPVPPPVSKPPEVLMLSKNPPVDTPAREWPLGISYSIISDIPGYPTRYGMLKNELYDEAATRAWQKFSPKGQTDFFRRVNEGPRWSRWFHFGGTAL